MDAAALALLGVVVGVLLWRALTRERRDYGRFKRLRSTVARQKVYRRWLIEGVLALGGLSLATIVGAWGQIPVALAAAQEWEPIAAARTFLAGDAGIPVVIAVAVLVLAALVLPVVLIREPLDEAPAIGDIRALLPRTRGELPYGAALSVSAGVFEELLFRLGLPALVFAVTGNAFAAFLGATLLFGILHLYQGPLGIVFSTVLGAIFVLLYLVTGSILVPIVLHVLIDLRSMVLIPIALGRVLAPRAV
ncbi:CPBP family intramembrane glutamic endopeptidase [Pseudolysinimonas sp.]|uniref:CPBP family intramembrane glutamic endopeptidase n=1 Tax=Pseudolysinimonas sp. TaxID=2680009 RepID=UPI00286CD504|nr:CPBP family intramembrane glutamic endopeptidase [Pseudolysinimonas sp.]